MTRPDTTGLPAEQPGLTDAAASGHADERLRPMIDALASHAMSTLDAEGRFDRWFSGGERLTGYAESEVLGRDWSLLFRADDIAAERPQAELAQARAQGSLTLEGWRRRRDGSRFWAGVDLVAVRDQRGQLMGYTQLLRDLTERKHQQDLLARIAEASPTAMLLVDRSGAIRYLNTQAERMFGYERAQLEGQSIHRLIPQRFHAVHAGHMRNFMSAVDDRPMGAGRDLFARRSDGSEIEVEVGLSGLDSGDGPAVLAAVVDVSERRRQRRELEAALGEKDTLLKEVYHRVKNNLQVVQSLLNMQRRSIADGPARAALDDSALRVRAMAMVHEQLYSSGNLAAVPLRAYTVELLHHIGLSAGAAARGIVLRAEVDAIDTALDGAIPYGLLLAELVTNSLKHAFANGRTGAVTVRLTRDDDGAALRVADDGPGLPAGFEFQRSRTLGLQLAVSLARQLGGELEACNDAGAVFTARLPRL